jgi:hypothetical protein
MNHAVGDRVIAISHSEGDTVYVFGLGTYEGEHIPLEATGWAAEALREYGIKNHRIRLDSGQVVYGCECWWGLANVGLARLGAFKQVELVDIDEKRAAFGREEAT